MRNINTLIRGFWGGAAMTTTSPALAILGFHKIGEPPVGARSTPWYIPEATFRNQLRYLSTNGWEVISVASFLRGLSEPETLPRRAALLTFDDGYKSMLRVASRCLSDFGYPSVAFIPTQFVGGYNDWDREREPFEEICDWDGLRELERCGCSIQSHGVRHKSFSRLPPREQQEELYKSKMILEEKLGKSVEVFAYPYGLVGRDRTALSALLERNGYRAACLFPGGVSKLPVANNYFLPRVDMFPHSDLRTLLAQGVASDSDKVR
jgi:peptidoglycan/xylan/chitin deacetylase (PgdA/CDA1 family)